MCDDLFFARYRRSSALARTLSSLPTNDDLESASRMLLESVFGDAHTEADKSNVVEGLLDAKLLRGANKDGVHFTNDGIVERLSKYSNFAVESKLRSFLGDVEDKATQARLQGTEEFIDKRLHELQGPQAKERPISRYVQSRGNLMSRGMSRQISRAMATSRTATGLPISGKSPAVRSAEDEDLYKTFLQVCSTSVGPSYSVTSLIVDNYNGFGFGFSSSQTVNMQHALTIQKKTLFFSTNQQLTRVFPLLSPVTYIFPRFTHRFFPALFTPRF